MPPFSPAPICPSCIFVAISRNVSHIVSRPCAAQRFLSTRATTTPSRMVLSHDVARSSNRDARDHSGKKRQWKSAGPFGGMNQTVAPIREPMPRRTPRARDGRDGRDRRDRDSSHKKDEPRTKAMKMRGSLATIPYGHRSRTKSRMTEIESFDNFDLLPSLKDALSRDVLKGMVGVRPTPIQRIAIPALLDIKTGRRSPRTEDSKGRKEFLLAAETGSGKTLAYLLPIVNAMKKAEEADPAIAAYREYFSNQMAAMKEPGYTGPREFDPHPTTGRPKVVVLVPTAELVSQVGIVAKALSHEVKFKACLFSANISAKVINASMYSPTGIDLIIATPHLLASMADSDPNILSRVSHLVIDEADSLFDRGFSPITTSILDRALPSMKQLVLCSATIPKRLDNYMRAQFPDIIRLTTPNLHAIPRRVILGVIDVSKHPYRNNKNLACLDAIYSISKEPGRPGNPDEVDVKRIMVFVNEREQTQEVADYLSTNGVKAIALHRDTPEKRQSEMLNSFTTSEPMTAGLEDQPDSSPTSPPRRRKILPNVQVIVATDLASRGIDTLGVRHVILYDVPHTTIDFIHRLGRAGRMGRRGRGIVLAGSQDHRDIIAEVRDSMFRGQALL
ncbi:ATP-dependent RNA helicase mrh-4 [Hypoxylon rubiginosum]|uniref:ATP-dependent RNA helicase mrh-4 n=1 Tax=Hypoxylon rubiginosum TaxID=110542 RepID=A0ACB9YUD0_9PEZI|nr:ATP-dependent RNA helicase mrh-4 [Hypoxylon rubiginosum]